MKKLLMGIALTATLATQSAAQILNVSVLVNPWVTLGYDPATTTAGTVKFTVTNERSSTENLKFLHTFTSSLPLRTPFSATPNQDLSQFSSLIYHKNYLDMYFYGGNELKPGESVVLFVDYQLTSPLWYLNAWQRNGRAESPAGKLGQATYTAASPPVAAVVPEPGTFALLGSSLAGLGLWGAARRRKEKA